MNHVTGYRNHAFVQRQAARLIEAFQLSQSQVSCERFQRMRDFDLHIDEYLPAKRARGTALLIHGGGAHGRMLAPFANPLLAQGFRVLAPDLPGFGLTRGPIARVTYAEWIEFVAELADEAAQRGPVVLFGLSVGGMTALRAAQRARNVSGVIATTLVDLSRAELFDAVARTPLLGRLARLGFRFAPRLLDRMTVPLHWLAPLDKMTSDATLAALLIADPLLGRRRVSLRFFRTLHEFAPASATEALGCPFLLVHPGRDRWTPVALSMPAFEAVRGEKELVVLREGEHAPLEPAAFRELSVVIGAFLQRVTAADAQTTTRL